MSPRTSVTVIVNPKAGGGRALRAWKELQPLFRGHFRHVTYHETEAPGHATFLAQEAVRHGTDLVVGVGGDGTLHEIVNGMLPGETPLGVLPFGTGNDFARGLGIPRNLRGAWEVIAGSKERRIDLGRVHGQYYIQIAGTGFDAMVAQKVNEGGRAGTGALTYVATLLRVLLRYQNQPLQLQAERRVSGKSLLVAVGNTTHYAGGMKMCPEADPEDGLLDWIWLGDLGRLEILRALPLVFSGRHIHIAKAQRGRAPAVTIEGPSDLPVHADGEVVGTLPATFEAVPKALTVLVP
ncbi:MAG: diacylglycerol kinase family lipid kinase [Clostridiales bacterium]|nr:diacylglycerol kinase family lipid kinase [Clostridiales bacterium]